MSVAESDAERRPASAVLFDETADQRLAEVFAPCFTLILQLRATDAFGEPSMLRRRIKNLLDDAEREALRTGVSTDNIQAAKFALVAFIDETILSSNWPQKDEWVSTPLQLELYDQFDAGEVFFDRLEDLRRNAQAHGEALEVYYLCMTLGFKGRYQLHEQERLREIIETTYDELRRLPGMGSTALAPHGAPRGQVAEEVRSNLPTWVLAAAAVVLALLIYTGMYMYISSEAADVASTVQQIGGASAP